LHFIVQNSGENAHAIYVCGVVDQTLYIFTKIIYLNYRRKKNEKESDVVFDGDYDELFCTVLCQLWLGFRRGNESRGSVFCWE
jgi:hypothetical protein